MVLHSSPAVRPVDRPSAPPNSPGTGRSKSGRRSPLGCASLRAPLANARGLAWLLGLALVAACDGKIGEGLGLAVPDASYGDARADGGALGDDAAITAADASAPDAWEAPLDAAAEDATPPDPTDGGAAPDATDPCAQRTCPPNARCSAPAGTCACLPGFIDVGGSCVADTPGNPALHTQEEVCRAWAEGHVENAPNGGFSVSAAMCDPGSLSRDGLDDALRRLNMFRWLAGVGATSDSLDAHRYAQACALVSAWNPAGQAAHFPQPTAECYTPEGAQGAGSSNIAWGNVTAAAAMDQWIVDWGNETTYGHRRWLLGQQLWDVGIGAYQGGNNYGSTACITIFGGGNPGAAPPVIIFPPPGFVPSAVADWEWTLQGQVPQSNLTVTVREGSTGQLLSARAEALAGGYGSSSALRVVRDGWRTREGETYDIEVGGDGVAPIVYALKPIACP